MEGERRLDRARAAALKSRDEGQLQVVLAVLLGIVFVVLWLVDAAGGR